MALIAELKPEMSGPALAVIENLEKASLRSWKIWPARCLPLISRPSAAIKRRLSGLHCRSTGRRWPILIPGKARAEYGEQRQYCPVCGSMPVSSMVQIGTTQGLRYLHCNL